MFNQSFGHPSVMGMGETVSLVSLELFKTRDYHDQHRRSYTCQLTGHTLENLSGLIGQMGADRAFTLQGISQLNNMGSNTGLDAGGIIRYASSPSGLVPIANGWQLQRCRFVLVVDVFKNSIKVRRETIVGYADRYGISELTPGMPSFDQNMQYTIDSIKTEPYEMVTGIAGMNTNAGIGATALVLSNQAPLSNPFTQNGSNALYTMRPVDVFTIADSQELLAGASDSFGNFETNSGQLQINGQSYIADATLTSAARTSNRKNDLPSTYASRVMTNFYQTAATANTAAGDDFMTPASGAMMRTKETSVSDSSFAFALRNIGGSCSVTGQFTHAELMRIDPTLDSRTNVNRQSEASLVQSGIYIPSTHYMEPAYKTSHHAVIAQMMANTILSLMSTHGMLIASAICDNYTGTARCVLNGAVGLTPENRETLTRSFETSMAMEALGIIASSGIGAFHIDIKADSTDIVYVEVKLNGEIQPTPHAFPAWAAAANTPIVSNDYSMISHFADQVSNVVESTLGARAPAISTIHTAGANGVFSPTGFGGVGGVGGFGGFGTGTPGGTASW